MIVSTFRHGAHIFSDSNARLRKSNHGLISMDDRLRSPTEAIQVPHEGSPQSKVANGKPRRKSPSGPEVVLAGTWHRSHHGLGANHCTASLGKFPADKWSCCRQSVVRRRPRSGSALARSFN